MLKQMWQSPPTPYVLAGGPIAAAVVVGWKINPTISFRRGLTTAVVGLAALVAFAWGGERALTWYDQRR